VAIPECLLLAYSVDDGLVATSTTIQIENGKRSAFLPLGSTQSEALNGTQRPVSIEIAMSAFAPISVESKQHQFRLFRAEYALRASINLFKQRQGQFGRSGLLAADRHPKNLLKSTSAWETTDQICFVRANDRNQVIALDGIRRTNTANHQMTNIGGCRQKA